MKIRSVSPKMSHIVEKSPSSSVEESFKIPKSDPEADHLQNLISSNLSTDILYLLQYFHKFRSLVF